MLKLERYNYNRELIRSGLREATVLDNNILVKDKLITISTQKTNYPISQFKKDIRWLNKRLNQRLIHRRKYKKSPNRIVFFVFIEKSKLKLLTHAHMILRVPLRLRHYVDTTIEKIIRKYLPRGFSLVISHQPDAIGYSSKYYSNYNEEHFDVF